MNRRPRLPGADELFRATGGAAQTAALAEVSSEPSAASRRTVAADSHGQARGPRATSAAPATVRLR